MLSDIEQEYIIRQKKTCERYATSYLASPFDKVIGVAIQTFNNKNAMPINGLRHPIESDISANWYIWAGDFSEDASFFKPMHVGHLLDICPQALQFLGLPPGWRFLFDDNHYEDVWYDEQLLII